MFPSFQLTIPWLPHSRSRVHCKNYAVYAWAMFNPHVFGNTAKKDILIGKNIVTSGLTCNFNDLLHF